MLSACIHASTVFPSFISQCVSPKLDLSCSSMAASSSIRIVVVGDVHDYWNFEQDSKALEFLQPDLVLFTGDFGDENVEVVQSVANVEFSKAVILGNHDAWFTKQFSKSQEKDKVQLQLECLGEEHVAYRRSDFPLIKVSVVGGRPFSCGGKPLSQKKLLSARYGIKDMDESAKRIQKAARGTPDDHFLILLAHNGPSDLAHAISLLKENDQVSIPLVVFGHMHKELAYGNGFRKMIVVGPDNTIYLNGAIVPRVKRLNDEDKRSLDEESALSSSEAKGTRRAFTLVEISEGRVAKIAESWVSVVEDRTTLEEEHILYEVS
ncbi:uncharacterized protein LOC124834900 isoform X2 [Vigna umbellata]|uniref:uncharacterized protein LOC124834900 isoform X2 n=1 Tax=Vigna umbellata TaxID=87088 RepID=UPI001F5EFF8E|nr:uncharacterized protein LOC124834900 isoform X2 [Vigna umbellata]